LPTLRIVVGCLPTTACFNSTPAGFHFLQFLPERRSFAHQFGDGLAKFFVGRF
jgi:hypothetical protein